MKNAEALASSLFVDGWYTPAIKHVSPHVNERPDVSIDLLVIHNISLPAGTFSTPYVRDLFLGQLDCCADPSFADLEGVEVSAHFFINRAGSIEQFVPIDKRAWHAGVSSWCGRENCNDFSVGIELEGTDEDPYTEVQYQSLVLLTQALMGVTGITADAIVGHCDIAPARKTDPGPSFDWPYYRQLLEA